MKVTLEAFLQSLQKFSRKQLIQKLVQMKENEMNQSVVLAEMRNTSTAMTRDYSKIQESNRKLPAENTQLKKDNKRLCEENAQLLRKVFGRQSEKVIYMDEENVPEDPLSEEAKDTEEPANEKPADLPDTPAVGKAGLTVLPGKKGSKKKKPRHGMNLDKLPADHIFNVHAEKLDTLYGEGNWTIISWHVRRTVERIPELDYVQYTHVPVVAVGPERKLVALPFEDALRNYSIATASLVASIMFKKYALGIPLYRQEWDLQMRDFPLSRQDMANWITNPEAASHALAAGSSRTKATVCAGTEGKKPTG